MRNLYDERGYQVRIECAKTFNPKLRGESEDARDLSVFFTYIGAVSPEYEDASHNFENDAFVVSRLDTQNASRWNQNAVSGFWGMELGGTWGGKCNTINLKDPGILISGLKITYITPEQMESSNAVMKIFVNDDLMKEVKDRKSVV